MNYIWEVLTKPQYQRGALDDLVIATLFCALLAVVFIALKFRLLIEWIQEKIEERK